MHGFGIHSSIWTMRWTPQAAENAVTEAVRCGFDFVEVALLDPGITDAAHNRALIDRKGMRMVCSLGLPQDCWPSHSPDKGEAFLRMALDKTAAMGAEALTGVTYGGIGERTGLPPTQTELDNVARCLSAAASHAKRLGIGFGIEPVNRYETHLINTGWQAVDMIERVGADNIFIHLDTYHMNIEEKGAAAAILAARDHLRYIHLSESDRGVPGQGTVDWDEIFAALAAIRFSGGMAMESFINMPPELAFGLSVWRPVAQSTEAVIREGLPFLRQMSRKYTAAPLR